MTHKPRNAMLADFRDKDTEERKARSTSSETNHGLFRWKQLISGVFKPFPVRGT